MTFSQTPLLIALQLSTSSAAVTVTWTEIDTGVTATYTGFIDTSALGVIPILETQPERAIRNNQSFAFYDGGELRRYRSARTIDPPVVLDSNPEKIGTGSGAPFSFAADDLFVDADYISGSNISGTAFFAGETLGTMFPSDFNELQGMTTPVWFDSTGQPQVAYTLIPEASKLALTALGLASLCARRKRP